jgi:hypothetical protein
LISSRGTDSVGHQLEAKISCIATVTATAATLKDELEYVHIPMYSDTEHGVQSIGPWLSCLYVFRNPLIGCSLT